MGFFGSNQEFSRLPIVPEIKGLGSLHFKNYLRRMTWLLQRRRLR